MKLKPNIIRRKLPLLIALAFTTTVSAQTFIGQWDFENGNLAATAGSALAYADGAGGATETGTQFGTTAALGLPSINGTNAAVMSFPAAINGMGYSMSSPPSGNGGGSQVNEWTLVADVLYPSAANSQFRPVADVDGSSLSTEAEFAVTAGNALGVPGGAAFGEVLTNTWYRLGVTVTADQTAFYINGQLAGTSGSGGVDGRFALAAGGTALIFGTPGTAAAPGYVNSIQVRDFALSSGQMVALGGPSAAGIPQTIPPVPSYLEKWVPAAAVASRSTPVGAVINRGETTIANNSISLKLDGTALTGLQITTSGTSISVMKSDLPPLTVNSTHTLELTYTDSVAGAKTFTHQFKAVLLYENFDELPLVTSIEENAGTLNAWTPTPPVGWVTNHSGMPGYGDLENDGRTEWAGWTFARKEFWISADDQTRSSFALGQGTLAIADPDEWDDATHPKTDENGNSLYFNSFLSTPSINIAGIPANTVSIKFDSSWRPEGFDDWGGTNNQTATIDVSYDGGAAVTVLHWDSKEGGQFFHPDSQNEPILIQLQNPATATTMTVTFGLTLGANDWWWAFDNLEINAGVIAPTISVQPQSQISSLGADALFNVQAAGTAPLSYQWFFKGAPISDATNNQVIVSSVTTNSSGDYHVVVSNGAGSVNSSPATLTVFSGSITQDLVVHLKLDGTYADATGRGNNAEAVNTPTFEPGVIGQGIHITSTNANDPNNYVTLSYPEDLKFGTSDFSFAFWTKVLYRTGDKAFISNKDWDSGSNRGLVIFSESGGIDWNYRDDQSARRDSPTVSPGLNDAAWHHVVVTFERNSNGKIYVDGQLANVTSIAPDAGKPVGKIETDDLGFNWNLGQDGTGLYGSEIEMVMDDLGIWHRALTPQESLAIYTAGLATNDLTQAVVPAGKVPPSITQQPVSRTLEEGLIATFEVKASGTEPFQYQWYHNDAPLAGATASILTISNLKSADSGSYKAVVSNGAGSATSSTVTLTVTAPAPVAITGQWDFDASDLRATVGSSLTNFNAAVGTDTMFGTTASFGIADIAGAAAKVLYFAPAASPWGGYIMPHGAVPNGGGTYVNRYTVIYDVLYPAGSNSKWRSLLQTATGNNNDGDFFVNTANGIGISGNYQGTVPADAWTRIVGVFDLPYATLRRYINGAPVGSMTLGAGTDGRWSLDPTALLFADEDGDASPGYVNSVQFRNGVMTDAEVAALGGVTTDGIPGMRPSISGIAKTGDSVVITWQGAPGLKLQQNTTLNAAGWTDVPGTAGASTATVLISGGAGFFRLAQ